MSHPYENLPKDKLWRTAVAGRSAFEIEGLWKPRFQIRKRQQIMTAGSCFAQHISSALIDRNYKWVDAEPAPEYMTEAAKRDYQYGTFSFRTGNIYTAKMLNQWMSWVAGVTVPPEIVWEKDGRFYDPFRPAIELNGFATEQEVYASRQVTIAAIETAIKSSSFFFFTLGLTEAWHDKEGDFEYAICPGTVAGEFDPVNHLYVNHGFRDTFRNLSIATKLARKINNKLKFIFTVSPVPLVATASDQHVLVASNLSKSILRLAANEMVQTTNYSDYFPSYEIITHSAFRGMFFNPNMRTVTPAGVAFVMDRFFSDQTTTFTKTVTVQGPYGVEREQTLPLESNLIKRASGLETTKKAQADEHESVLCEEEFLDAFSK